MRISRQGNKQRLLDALSLKFTGEVPFLEVFVAGNIVEQVMGRFMDGKSMLQLDAPDYVEFLQRTGMDAGYLYSGWNLGRKNKVDETGQVHYIDGTIKSQADFDQIKLPSLDIIRRKIEAFLASIKRTNLGTIYALDDALSLVFTAIGPTDSLMSIIDNPGFVDEFLDRVEEYTLPALDVVLEYPVDALFLTGLRCMKTGPILSPEMHEQFILPRIEKMMDIIRSCGVPVFLHSDGDNTVFMEWITKTGFTALHPIEPSEGSFDIYNLKELYGNQICLCGNIDVGGVLSCGTPAQVYQNTLEHLQRLAPGGGYICGSSHDITHNVPFENFKTMAETICSYIHEDQVSNVPDGSIDSVRKDMN